MFKKLLEYNWKVFRHSLTGMKIFILIFYGLILALIFSQVISTVFVVITLQNTELSEMFNWYTPERGRFILLAFTNLLWLAQFFFTNIRLMRLNENRKLLTMGYPILKLSRYLTLLAFAHPLNLLFNATWFILLMLQFDSLYYLPVTLAIVLLNFSLIFSAKFRVLTAIKNYQKWLLIILLCILIVASGSVRQLFSNAFFTHFEQYIHNFNQVAIWLPGGILASAHAVLQPLASQLALLFTAGGLILWLHRDHMKNIRKALQRRTNEPKRGLQTGKLRSWLCLQFGHHAGKYVYYVVTHPYNKIQALIFVAFPILYVPYMLSQADESGMATFFVLFFFIYAPLGFLLMFVGNLFGYEHREFLQEMQFPISLNGQLKQRVRAAVIIPLTLLVIVSGAELILLIGTENLLSIMLGNILVFELFLMIFLWSSFNHFQPVKWVSFSLTQPVISQSVALVSGFMMLAVGAAVYIPYGPFEGYKLGVMTIAIVVCSLGIYRYINNIQQVFNSKISPDLWTKL